MSTEWLTFFALSLLVGSSTTIGDSASAPSDEAQVDAAEHGWINATVAGNADQMASYMSNDYVELVRVPGTAARRDHWQSTSKGAWISLIRTSHEKYDYVTINDTKAYFHDNVATFTGYFVQKGTRQGKSNNASGIYADTWVKKSGRWQLISSVFP